MILAGSTGIFWENWRDLKLIHYIMLTFNDVALLLGDSKKATANWAHAMANKNTAFAEVIYTVGRYSTQKLVISSNEFRETSKVENWG
ncbi:hypothetical protein HDU98_003817 [Podochytrium sp. JEL0797]|nr:hypothetical protein HDU98_003817 [Podochytrium sp. JEL0797]